MIKATLVGTAAALSLMAGSFAARAADAIVEAPAVYDWSGAYIGAQIGGAFGDENDDLSDNFLQGGLADDFSMNGFVGGVYGGINYQMSNNFLVGIEGDFSGSSYEGDHDFDGTLDTEEGEGLEDAVNADGNLEMKSDWQASIRGRVGYAFDRTLVYGTAGVAFARAELNAEGTFSPVLSEVAFSVPFNETDTKTLVGYTVGLGIEHAFTDNWIGRLEARYSDFGSETFDLGTILGDVKSDFNQGQVLVGISYKF